jgi:hypothetical protein
MEDTNENRLIHEVLSAPVDLYSENLWVNWSPIVCFPCLPLIKVHFILNMLSCDNIWVCQHGKLVGKINSYDFIMF